MQDLYTLVDKSRDDRASDIRHNGYILLNRHVVEKLNEQQDALDNITAERENVDATNRQWGLQVAALEKKLRRKEVELCAAGVLMGEIHGTCSKIYVAYTKLRSSKADFLLSQAEAACEGDEPEEEE